MRQLENFNLGFSEAIRIKLKDEREDSTEELIDKLKERDITKEQAHELEDFIYPFNHWTENQWEEEKD